MRTYKKTKIQKAIYNIVSDFKFKNKKVLGEQNKRHFKTILVLFTSAAIGATMQETACNENYDSYKSFMGKSVIISNDRILLSFFSFRPGVVTFQKLRNPF